MHRLAIGMVLLLLCGSLPAQESEPEYGWTREMAGGINVNQTSFDNWQQGGESSLAWQLFLNYKFVNDQLKTNWSNTGKMSYGRSKTGDSASRKSVDEIKLESVLTYKLREKIGAFVAGTGESQFAAGYDYASEAEAQVSAFWDPAYFRESAGLTYKPSDILQTRIGAALKQTLTRDYPAPYADDAATTAIEKTRFETGLESVTDLDLKLSTDSQLTSKLELFSNVEGVKEIDVSWDNVLTTKLTKFISVNINVKLFYDSDISARRQLKQALALGLSYTFL